MAVAGVVLIGVASPASYPAVRRLSLHRGMHWGASRPVSGPVI